MHRPHACSQPGAILPPQEPVALSQTYDLWASHLHSEQYCIRLYQSLISFFSEVMNNGLMLALLLPKARLSFSQ